MNFHKANTASGKKKILIFSLAYVPFVGGAELAVKEITGRISDFDFDLITLRFDKKWPKFEKIGNVNVYRISGGKTMFPFLAFCKARRLHKENKYGLIWSIMANRAGFASLFFKIFFSKTKFLLTLQEGDPVDYPEKRMGLAKIFIGGLFKKVFTKADYIQVISNYLADWAKKMGAKESDIETVPNGVNTQDIQGLPLDNPRTTLECVKKIIITTSRLVPKNGIDILIKATAKLKEVSPEMCFDVQILGAGPEEENLKKLAKELKVDDVVQFFGHIEPDKIPEYLARADIFVRPSRSEGLGSSFLEAMAVGLPVIGTKVGGIVDFIKDPEDVGPNIATGVFVKVDDPEDLAYKIRMLFVNNELAESVSRNGKWLAEKNYSWDSVALKMKVIFEKLCQ